MLYNKTIIVAGGDLRAAHLAKLLAVQNNVFTIGLEKADEVSEIPRFSTAFSKNPPPDYIVLPVPAADEKGVISTPFSKSKLTLGDIADLAGINTAVLGGAVNEETYNTFAEKGCDCIDYLKREELAIMNAIPTAEGTLQLALEELPYTIYGLNAVIVGYGRISRVMARLLKNMGANVTVSARKFSDLAWIEANGYCSVLTENIANVLQNALLVINTVPAPVLNEASLIRLPKNSLVIDLASKPGGVDFEVAKKLSIKTIWALSLPGKTAPYTAGQIIYDTIVNIDSERGAGK